MFNMEPDTFDNFFHAIYWATISLTTIGYGDVYPQSMLGQAFTIISAFVGVAVIALPSGIIAGGFMDEIHKEQAAGKEDTDAAADEPEPEPLIEVDPLDRIEKLGELRDKGLLTDAEFEAEKTKLLSRL